MHLSLTKGKWKYDRWGLPIREVPPNAHLSAWFGSYLNAQDNWQKLTSLLSGQFCASINLIKPTETIRPKAAFRPFLSRADSVAQSFFANGSSTDQFTASQQKEYGFMAALPQEAICTENLTPWTKLLPCRGRKGIGSLLVATNLFNSQFISLSLDFRFTCSDITNCAATSGIELRQSILAVFDPPQVVDGRYSWTLNSLFNSPLQHHCPLATSSHVYVEATHLNANVAGRNGLNSSKLTVIPSAYVRFTDSNLEESGTGGLQVQVIDEVAAAEHSLTETDLSLYADYDLRKLFEEIDAKHQQRLQEQQQQEQKNSAPARRPTLNLGIQYPNSYRGVLPSNMAKRANSFSTVTVRRHARGYGVASGGLSVTLTNSLPVPVYALYLDTVPWYFRLYLHSLLIEAKPLGKAQPTTKGSLIRPSWIHYQPAVDRQRPHHLELLVQLPAASEVELRLTFDHQFLRWTEYPPDANHGLYITPASVTFYLPGGEDDNSRKNGTKLSSSHFERFLPAFFEQLTSGGKTGTAVDEAARRLALLQRYNPLRLYTEPVLISMPTPDFSMPYNVVCLVSTVLSIAFGPIYNITTRRTKLTKKYVEENVKGEGEEDKEPKSKKKKCVVM